MDTAPPTLPELARRLAAGETTSRDLVERSLDRIADPAGEGSRAFLSVDPERARATADAMDALRLAGAAPTPWAGIPVGIKDLADIEGQITGAGSRALADRPPASADAPVVARLRRAGFVLMGRTNMTEFAYSGLGINPHHDTPRSPWDRAVGHIPGGSSSGTAVAVADGMVAAGLGTDTGGSCRIPAAFCGVTGFKPTARRVPLDGIVPLSASLDSVGPLAPSVACCAIVDDIFAGGPGAGPTARDMAGVRLAAITDFVTDDLDAAVAAGYEAALRQLRDGGAAIEEVAFPELLDIPTIGAGGGIPAAEAYHWHRTLLDERGDLYDQRVRHRIEAGADLSAAHYLDALAGRQRLIDAAARRMVGYDAYALPTVAITPPALAPLEADDGLYVATNMLCLRNTAVGNLLDACAISVPCTPPEDAPVGLMLMGAPMADAGLLAVAAAVEARLGVVRRPE